MKKFETEDGLFDGAMYNPRDYRSEENVIDFIHHDNRLGLVRKKEDYYVAEFLRKGKPTWSATEIWNEERSSCICESEEEGMKLVSKYLEDERLA